MDWTLLDTWIVIAGGLAAMSCSLLGCFLVLRGTSMMGDTLSHAVLPGIAVAFVISGTRDPLVMLAGAAAVGLVTAALVQALHRFAGVDQAASMGIVLTTLFALGLIMIQHAAHSVHLDPDCVLFGSVELIPLSTTDVLGLQVPESVLTLAIAFLLDLVFVTLLWKELKITSFDPQLATSLGINAGLMRYLLMTAVAMTLVAAFESVGSILVVAMLIVPPAAAFLLTQRLVVMVALSLVLGLLSAVGGHVGAITVPRMFGYGDASSAGGMAVGAGVVFVLALVPSVLRHWKRGLLLDVTRAGSLRADHLEPSGAAPGPRPGGA